MNHPRPRVVISRCIDFDSCRYNGQVIRASLRDEFEPHVDFVPICPELEIGLGVPRDPVRLLRRDGEPHMVQPATGRDVTAPMQAFSKRFLSGVGPADAFILKARSPSCGVRNAKVFHRDEDGSPARSVGAIGERRPREGTRGEEDGAERERVEQQRRVGCGPAGDRHEEEREERPDPDRQTDAGGREHDRAHERVPEDLVAKDGLVVVEPDPRALPLDQLRQAVLLERERDELVQRVPENGPDDEEHRRDEEVGDGAP